MTQRVLSVLALLWIALAFPFPLEGQVLSPKVRTVTIPISIFTKKEVRENRTEEMVNADQLIVREDSEQQEILSIRSVTEAPLLIALIIQDDLANGSNLQLEDIKRFIRGLPQGTRVMTAYTRSGTFQVRQRFTDNLDAAADSLRIVSASSTFAPRSPYDGVEEVLSRFDAVPAGRRAVLLFSDGLDTSQDASLASITQSFDLEQAILKAQRRSVAVYSFYYPTARAERGSSIFLFAAQGALTKLSEETGGRAFYQGTLAPVSFTPFFREMVASLSRQFALTYVSTHMKKGYHRILVLSTNPEIVIEHPKGYYYR